jgi:hypothetical protein
MRRRELWCACMKKTLVTFALFALVAGAPALARADGSTPGGPTPPSSGSGTGSTTSGGTTSRQTEDDSFATVLAQGMGAILSGAAGAAQTVLSAIGVQSAGR